MQKDIGSPLCKEEKVVGIFSFGMKGVHQTAIYTNLYEEKVFINRATKGLLCQEWNVCKSLFFIKEKTSQNEKFLSLKRWMLE